MNMRSLGLDVGGRRTGVAISDPLGVLALPLTVIDRKETEEALAEIVKLVRQYRVECIVVGLPYSLEGHLTAEAEKVKAFTEKLRDALAAGGDSEPSRVSIQMWDERLSTVTAERLMIEAKTRKDRRAQHRDAIAAAIVLQGFLDNRHSESFATAQGRLREGEEPK